MALSHLKVNVTLEGKQDANVSSFRAEGSVSTSPRVTVLSTCCSGASVGHKSVGRGAGAIQTFTPLSNFGHKPQHLRWTAALRACCGRHPSRLSGVAARLSMTESPSAQHFLPLARRKRIDHASRPGPFWHPIVSASAPLVQQRKPPQTLLPASLDFIHE